jgi:hypothetical protein
VRLRFSVADVVRCRRGSIAPMLRACRMIDTKIIELIKEEAFSKENPMGMKRASLISRDRTDGN